MQRLTLLLCACSLWGWLTALLWLNSPDLWAYGKSAQALLWPLMGIFLTLGQIERSRRGFQRTKALRHLQLLGRNVLGAGILGSMLLLIYHLGHQETVPQLAQGLQQASLPLLYSVLIHLGLQMPLQLWLSTQGEAS